MIMPSRVGIIRYEKFVQNPFKKLVDIKNLLNITAEPLATIECDNKIIFKHQMAGNPIRLKTNKIEISKKSIHPNESFGSREIRYVFGFPLNIFFNKLIF